LDTQLQQISIMRTRNADSSSKSTTLKKTPPAKKSVGESPAAKRTPPSKARTAKKTEASPVTDPDQSRKFFFPFLFRFWNSLDENQLWRINLVFWSNCSSLYVIMNQWILSCREIYDELVKMKFGVYLQILIDFDRHVGSVWINSLSW